MNDKLGVANEVLASFAADTRITFTDCKWRVEWPRRNGEIVSYRWACRGQSFYPVWSRKWAHGGTACVALSQLVRWCSGKPVLPLSSWLYWASPTVQLLSAGAVEILKRNEYPETVRCVLCKNEILGALDWWHLGKVSGPCCHYASGCRQERKS